MTIPLPGPLWLIGCGNMAGAMLAQWLESGMNPAQLTVVRPSGAAVAEGVRVLTALPEDEVPAIVLLGVKPQKLDEVAPRLARALDAGTVLISILAGVELASLRSRFAAPRRIYRAMPNLPVRLGKGITNMIGSEDEAAHASIERLMAALGHVEWFDDEARFALAGHLTGAGPAFLFRFIDALSNAAAELGLPIDQAERLALAMAKGASAMAAASEETPETLARRVTSPGGTTEAGLKVLDETLPALLRATLTASRRRGEELAEIARSG